MKKVRCDSFDLFVNHELNLFTEPTKIGTNYSRVIPSKEINSKDRDIFWKKEEEEERIRIEVELGRKKNAQLELEKVGLAY